jgi:hypothetical protein
LQQTADTSGVLALQTANTTALTLDASQNATFAGYVNAPNTFGFKNRLLNGGMVIDQRNAGASVTQGTSYTYVMDRFAIRGTVTSKFTGQRSTTAPAGFVNSLLCTSSSAYSVGAAEAFFAGQIIEGLNCADLGWGTTNAATVTLSFWVRSSLTGTFGGSLCNYAGDRSYPFTYTISAANTWEQKSVTIAGDQSGTWPTDNGGGIVLNIGLGAGSTLSGTAGAWAGALYRSATGATSVVGTSGATFYITGVQLEKGSTATSFDYRPYGTELALCQRYYSKMSASSGGPYAAFASGFSGASNAASLYFKYPVQMRAAPTLTLSNCAIQSASGAINAATASTFYPGSDSGYLIVLTTGQTLGYGSALVANNNASAYLDLSSEL